MNMDSSNIDQNLKPTTNSLKFKAYKMFLQTLAADARLKIIQVLEKKSLCANEIVTKTGYEQTLISHHLKVLEHHGMVFVEKRGKFKYYTLNQQTIQPLLGLIDAHTKQYCCKIVEGTR